VPKLGTNIVIANGVLLNGHGHPCVLVNGDEIRPSNSGVCTFSNLSFKWPASKYPLLEQMN